MLSTGFTSTSQIAMAIPNLKRQVFDRMTQMQRFFGGDTRYEYDFHSRCWPQIQKSFG
jgi:hypothetical protein